MADLRSTARWWLANRSDTHVHATTAVSPLQLFEEREKSALPPLPAHPYDSCEVALRVCGPDGFIEHDTNFYSVPVEYVADILTVKASEEEIFVYSPDLVRIARHERRPLGAREKMEDPAHRLASKARYGLEPVREAFLRLGEHAGDFLDGLKSAHPRNCGFQARRILRQKENYHCDDIDAALGHASKYRAFDGKVGGADSQGQGQAPHTGIDGEAKSGKASGETSRSPSARRCRNTPGCQGERKSKMEEDPMERLRRMLEEMKLRKIAEELDAVLSEAEREGRATFEVLERLFAMEYAALAQRRIERRIKDSKLDELKLLDDFDFDFQKSIDKRQIMDLATLGFAERGQWLILAGSSGTGKSHIAKALLLLCCKRQYRCRYTTASDMLRRLLSGLADDTVEEKLKQYVRPQVLLIDEIGFDRLEQEESRKASLFFKVVEGRYRKNSTILTTNIDFKALGDYLGDPVITASLVDRMVHHAVIINIEGPSYRMHESETLNRPPDKGKK